MNTTELKELIKKGESETVEFKKSTSELKEAVISISSILNKHMKGDLFSVLRMTVVSLARR